MRNSKACPKCKSTDTIRIPGTIGAYSGGDNIITGTFSGSLVTRYLCASCGFSEEWIDSVDDIARIKKKYAS